MASKERRKPTQNIIDRAIGILILHIDVRLGDALFGESGRDPADCTEHLRALGRPAAHCASSRIEIAPDLLRFASMP